MKNTGLGPNLHTAAVSGSLDQVKALLSDNVDPNTLNQEGNTALMEAVRHYQAEVGFVLMESGANLNVKNAEGNTALHLAVYELTTSERQNELKAQRLWWFLKELYGRGALPLKNHANSSPLMITAIQNDSFASNLLMGFCRDEARSLPFQCNAGDYFKALCAHHNGEPDPFSDLSTESSVSKVLTTKEVNQILKIRFFSALRIGNVEAIKGLVKRYKPISELVKEKSAAVNFMLKQGAGILSIAQVKEVIATLVQLGADLNKAEVNGDTPLRICMVDAFHVHGSKTYPADDLVAYLLQCGADPNAPFGPYSTGWGDTSKFFGLIKQPYEGTEEQALAVAKALLEHGAFCGFGVIRFNAKPWLRTRMEQALSCLIESYKTPDPKNLIDQALVPIMKPENITLVAAAIAQDLMVAIEDEFRVSISKVCDAAKCQKPSLYSTHHLAYLLSLSKNLTIEAMPRLTSEQQMQIAPLIVALSDADCQNSLNNVFARGGADEFKEGKAALMIQKHVRGYLARKNLCGSRHNSKTKLPVPQFEVTL